jgi:predicted metal-dependent phosphoesterase TrpH
MKELIVNLHIHTRFSDGEGSHSQIGNVALKIGIDVVIITDHNILVRGVDQYFQRNHQRVLMLVGEEIHNQDRQPQKSHLLVFDANRELASNAVHPQELIDCVRQSKGLSFLAHPFEKELALFGEDDISWADWDVDGFTGIELWNFFSEFKNIIKNRAHAIFLAFFPQYISHAPEAETLRKWDSLLAAGKKIVAIGGGDSHALHLHLGPLKRTVFPYALHFSAINTHILVPDALTGDLEVDKKNVYQALKKGHCFIGNDLPAPTYGFRFSAQSDKGIAIMGDELSFSNGYTLTIKLPEKSECLLIKDGTTVQRWSGREICTHISKEPGIYRVESYRSYLGHRRGWIFSNPITMHRT